MATARANRARRRAGSKIRGGPAVATRRACPHRHTAASGEPARPAACGRGRSRRWSTPCSRRAARSAARRSAIPTGLCAPCWRTIELPPEPACDGCGSPIDPVPRSEARLCPACRVARPAHDGLTTATLYTEPSRRLVLALKHGRKLSLAAMMGRMIAARLPPLAPDAVIVPVPLHWSRLWARGYNQAALIARELSRRTGAAFVPDALVRRARTPKLGGLDRSQRRSVLASAGIAVRDRRVAARPILLVDDVVTSGATTDACVAALREAGAGPVRVACLVASAGKRNARGLSTPGVRVTKRAGGSARDPLPPAGPRRRPSCSRRRAWRAWLSAIEAARRLAPVFCHRTVA